MTNSALQDRIRNDDKAFGGLLSLIPAKMYYGEDTSDQWRKKKQSREQAKTAKRGRLNPDSALNRNAKEVMDERARSKRKLEDLEDDEDANSDENNHSEQDDSSASEGILRERPGEGMKKRAQVHEPSTAKKPRLSDDAAPTEEAKEKAKKAKEQRREAKKLKKDAKQRLRDGLHIDPSTQHPSTEVDETTQEGDGVEMKAIDVGLLASEENDEAISSPKSDSGSASRSPIFDSHDNDKNRSADSASTATSTSSTDRPKPLVIPKDTTLLRARLAAKLEQLRAQRKADGADGKPIRTRQELIESRREKQAQRKAHKKETRRLAKEEEDRKREEALSSARNSPGSILSPMVDETCANHFAFGRVNFADGTQMSHDLSYEKKTDKKKGPSDPKTALLKLEAQKKRVAQLDADKRKEVLEKETWLAARKRAEGEKVRDDEALLKKALKRKEKTKKKSEREWKERAKGVDDAIKARQRKREENLRKRKEEKHAGKGKGKKKGPTAKKSRPGFEGSFGIGGKKR